MQPADPDQPMKTMDYIMLGGAILLAFVVARLFRPSEDDKAAARFGELWELFSAEPGREALRRGTLQPNEISAVTPGQAAMIALDVERLNDAPSNWYAWDDDERSAIAAVTQRSHAEQILFAELFIQRHRITPGAFLRTFMSPSKDADYLAQIVHHVEAIRP